MPTLFRTTVLLLSLVFSQGAAAQTLRMAYDADPVTLDPQEVLSEGTIQLNHMVFDPLLRWNQAREFEPRLATDWQRLDDRTWRIQLRQGVVFHSGNPFSADDVVFTLERIRQSADFKALFSPIKSARAIDEHTVELVTHQPYPLLLNTLSYLFPMDRVFYSGNDDNGNPKAALVKHGSSFASRHSSGTGPFRVVARQQGVKVEFERFDRYWDTASPGNVSRIEFTPIKEEATRVAALLAGDVDYIAPVPPQDLPRLRANDAINLVTMISTRVITLQLNQQRQPAFQDVRVRQAVVHAINNEAIAAKLLKGFATAAAQQSPPGYLGHVSTLTPRFDLAKAKQLMQEAGYEKGFEVSMLAPNNRYVLDEKIAQAVVNMLAKINIRVSLRTVPKAQYWPLFDERAADILMIGWHPDTEDSANFTEYLVHTPQADTGLGQYNSGQYSNTTVDTLVQAANREFDPAKRAEHLQAIEHLLYEEAAFVPLHWQHLAWAARRPVRIEHIVNVMNFPYLGDLVIEP